MTIETLFPKLIEGWQARLSIKMIRGRTLVEKIYGAGRGWSMKNAMEVEAAMHLYRKWLQKNGILLAPTTHHSLVKKATGWLIVIRQEYLGQDFEILFRRWSRFNHLSRARSLFRDLLEYATLLAWHPVSPNYRCEIKPRDFCLDTAGRPVLVDTFPVVLARRGMKIIVAPRKFINACIISRESKEVLDVTGSALGILRNLCEHMIAIYPRASGLWIKDTLKKAFSLYRDLGAKLEDRLNSHESKLKVNTLMKRINLRYMK